MKIRIEDIDRSNFIVRDFDFNGETLHLVFPQHMGCEWNMDNLIFRSSIWNDKGEPVSFGFKKFFNWGEQPNLIPVPTDIKGCSIMEKIDGSALIVSKYKGHLIYRTRGTSDATQLANGNEIETFKSECNGIFSDQSENWDYSYIFEWTTPANKIILDYGDKPQFYLIGKIYHENYVLATQEELDYIAKEFNLKRPKRYEYDSIGEMIKDIYNWEGREGCVVYSSRGQILHKTKAKWYLTLHNLKSEINTVEKMVDIWLNWGKPQYRDFYEKIRQTFDYELAEYVKGNISKICDSYVEVNRTISHMNGFIESLKSLPSRKEQAQKIFESYGKTSRSGILFHILDGKTMGDDEIKELMIQILLKN